MDEDTVDSPLYELANAMLINYKQNACSVEEYENARSQAIDHLRYSTTVVERRTWSVALKED